MCATRVNKSPKAIVEELDAIEVDVRRLTTGPRKKPAVSAANKRKTGTRFMHEVLDSGLTPEQEAYCRARALGMGKMESVKMAGRAGNDGTTATAWEKIPAVKRRLAELINIATENSIIKTGLDRGWVISRLMSVTERCMQAEPVMDSQGKPTGEYKFDSAGANRSLELLGKTLKMFDQRDKEPEHDYAALSDEDLNRIATSLALETGILPAPDITNVVPR